LHIQAEKNLRPPSLVDVMALNFSAFGKAAIIRLGFQVKLEPIFYYTRRLFDSVAAMASVRDGDTTIVATAGAE